MPGKRAPAAEGDTFPIVGIGASAGGLESVSQLLRHLPADTGMAFVVIQHLGPLAKSHLAELLVKATAMRVLDVGDGVVVRSNHVYVLVPDFDVLLRGRRLRLVRRESAERLHMPVDHFFQSLAQEERHRAIGVVLSGTGSDGTAGLMAIKAAGGLTFAESESSAKYFAMPNSAVTAGCVDMVRQPKALAFELTALSGRPGLDRREPSPTEQPANFPERADALTKIFFLLKQHTKVDFGEYKQSTLRRRVDRRMALRRIKNLGDYTKILRNNAAEIEGLFDDFLINVTGFFRDPQAFDALQKHILPGLIKSRPAQSEIRVWVPGCATGEEVYSVAMCLAESLGEKPHGVRFQVFGTDLSERIISKARLGVYPPTIAEGVSAERLRRFFKKMPDGGYQITRKIRDMCTFARQNVYEDPPFSHLDLITCRNVLIYLGPRFQKKCISVFHYALNPGGHLMLGTSETVGGSADLFALVDKKAKIYLKKSTSYRPAPEFRSSEYAMKSEPPKTHPITSPEGAIWELQRQVDRLILARFSPKGVVIDEAMQVLQFRGSTSRYLEHASGAATLHLLQMVRPALSADLRAAVHRALKENRPVRREHIVPGTEKEPTLTIEVTPFRAEVTGDRLLLVTFEEEPAASAARKGAPKSAHPRSRWQDGEVQELRDELNSTKESLQAIIEEREAANEEMKSANEEIQSSNEELQSTNEELETAKEELQSANEELTTVNEELAIRNAELATLNNDLHNLLTSINIPIIIVDDQLRVRRLTAPGEEIFNLIPADVGRPLSNIRPNLDIPDLVPLIHEVIKKLTVCTREVRDTSGRWHQLRILPYRTAENKIDGAVITLVEIDLMKRGMAQLKNVSEFALALLDLASEPMLVLDRDLRVQQANRAFRERFEISKSDLERAEVHDLGDGWQMPNLRAWLRQTRASKQRIADFESNHHFPSRGPQRLRFCARFIKADGEYLVVLKVLEGSGPARAAAKSPSP